MKARPGFFRSFFFVGSAFVFLLLRSSEGVQKGWGQQTVHTHASPPSRIWQTQEGGVEVEGGVAWRLVGLPGPEQDEVDEVSMEEMAESFVLEGEADLEEVEVGLEVDGVDSEEDDAELEDDVEQVEDELEYHEGDSSSCSNHEGGNKTLEVSITSQAKIWKHF